MSRIITNRQVDLTALPFEATMRWDGTTAEIEAARPSSELQAAVDAASLNLRDENAKTLRQRADAALAANATYLAIASPTNAQITAQVRRLTQENNAIIRLLVGKLDTTDGTA